MGELVHLNCSSHIKSLCEGLWRLCKDNFKTDLVVQLSNHTQGFNLHHLVLAVFSTKLKHFSQTRFVLEQQDHNIDSADLNLIMEFAYLGKVKVEEERLPRLKAGAQALGINNLVEIIDQYHYKKSKMRKVNKRMKPDQSKAEQEISRDQIKSVVSESEMMVEEEKGTSDLEFQSEVNELVSDSSSDAEDGSDTSEYTPEKKPKSVSKKSTNKSNSDDGALPTPKKRGRHRLPYPYDEARKQYVCPTCDKGFKRRDNYCRHVRTHDQTAVFTVHKCPQCTFQTTNWTTWKSHLAAVHHLDPQGNVLSKNIKCPHCDFTCVSMFQLKNHNYFKHATKKFTCSECGYSCMRKSEMELHMRGGKHQSDRPYMCESCGNRFQYAYTLKCHMRTHTGEKPYLCKICGQSFSLSGTLKSHLLTHDTGRDRPFPCHLCQFASWRRHSLKIHYQHVHKVIFNNNKEFVSWHIQIRAAEQQIV